MTIKIDLMIYIMTLNLFFETWLFLQIFSQKEFNQRFFQYTYYKFFIIQIFIFN